MSTSPTTLPTTKLTTWPINAKDVVCYPNLTWTTPSDVPVGVVVYEQLLYVGNFLGTGCADFPQITIPDLTAWKLEVDLDMTNLGGLQNFIGDNETAGDRLKSTNTDINKSMSIRPSDNLEVAWPQGSQLQGRGRSYAIIECDESRNINLTISDANGLVDYGSITPPTSAIQFDCMGLGTGVASGFVGSYYSLKLYVNDVLVVNQTPIANDEFYESVSNTTTSPSGTGVTTGKVGGVVKISSQCFFNEGADYFDCGRPTNIVNKLRPQVDLFTTKWVGKINDITANPTFTFFGLGSDGSTPTRQLLVASLVSNLYVYVGGVAFSTGYTLIDSMNYIITASVNLTSVSVFVNGVLVYTNTGIGAYIGVDSLKINKLGDGGFSNFEGCNYSVSFYEGYTVDGSLGGLTIIDKYDFTNKSKWDGGPTMTSQNGNVATLTDGIPSTAYSKDLIPLEFL